MKEPKNQFPRAYALKSDDGRKTKRNTNIQKAYALKSDDGEKDQKKPIFRLML